MNTIHELFNEPITLWIILQIFFWTGALSMVILGAVLCLFGTVIMPKVDYFFGRIAEENG